MADQQRKVSLVFDVNSDGAKKRIDELASSLNKVLNFSTRSTGINSLDKDLQGAAQHAALLQTQLKNAFNVNTGKLDLTKFNDSLRQSGMSLEKYYSTFSKLGSAGEQAFSGLARSIATAEIPLRRTNNLLNDFAVTMKNTVKWQLSSSIMHGFLSSVQSAMSYAQNLNANLNEIRIVTGQSAEEMARFAEQANRSAKELSATTNQYAQAALIFYQQGLGDKAVKERTDAVIKMANVTGEAAKDVSSYMTAIWNNFDDGSKSLEYYADVITKLGAATAASSEEIAGGLEKFAAVADTIGLSYEYATAMLTTIIDKTRQSEDVVGTALKTILARIQGLNLGETLDDGTTLNKYSAALASVGVQIKDTSGELRSMDAILNDLGEKWQTLSKDTQVALAQVVGGVRQYNQIISLMDNWDAFEMNLDVAFNAEGELNKQAEIYAESWEAAQKRVQASMEAIYSSLIEDKFFIGVNNTFAEILKHVNNFIEGLGGVKGVLLGLSTVLMTVFNQQITSSLKNFTYNIQMMTKTGQQKIVELQKKSQTLLSKLGSDKGTVGGGIAADAYIQESNAQKQLLAISEKLSENEREVANILMQQLQLRTDQQVAAGQNASIAQQEMEISIMNLERLKSSMTMTPVGLNDIIDKIKTISAISPQMAAFYENAALIINNSSSDMSTKINDLKILMNELDQSGIIPEDMAESFQKLRGVLEGTAPSMGEIKSALNEFMLPLDKSNEEIELFIANLRKAAKEAENAGHTPVSLNYNKIADSLENAVKKTETYGDALRKAGIAQKDSAQATKVLNEFLEKAGIHTYSAQEKIVTYARTLGTLATAITQIKGLMDVWNDDTKSIGEKLLATATTISFLIPMIISSGVALKEMGISAITSKLALDGMSVAEIKAAVSTTTLSTAIKAALGPIGWIIAAITAVGVALAALYAESEKMQANTPEARAKRIAEKYVEAEEAVKNFKSSVTEAQQQFDRYNEIVAILEECTEGTQAWRDAMIELADITSTMLTNYPLLKDMINNPELYGIDNLRNEDGSINYDALFTAFNQRQVGATLGANIYANAREEESVQANEYLDVRSLAYSAAGRGNAYTSSKAYNAEYDTYDSALYSGAHDFVRAHNLGAAETKISTVTMDELFETVWAEFLLYARNQGATEVSEELFNSFIEANPELENIMGADSIYSSGYLKQAGTSMGMTFEDENISAFDFYRLYRGGNYEADNSWLLQRNIESQNVNPFIGVNDLTVAQMNDYLPYLSSATENLSVAPLFQTSGNYANTALFNSVIKEMFPDGTAGMNYLSGATPEMLLQLMQDFGVQGVTTPEQAEEIFGWSWDRGGLTYDQDGIKISDTLWQEMAMAYATGEMMPYIVDQMDSRFQSMNDTEQRVFLNNGDVLGTLTHAEIQEQQASQNESSLINWNAFASPYVGIEDENYGAWRNMTASSYNKLISLDPDQASYFKSLADGDYAALERLMDLDFSNGYQSLMAFEQVCSDLGIVLDKDSELYKNFADSITQGYLPTQRYGNFNEQISETIDLVEKLQDGTTEDISILEDSGLDLSNIVYEGNGVNKGEVDLSGILNDYTELQNIYKLLHYSPTDKSYDFTGDVETVAGYFGYTEDEWDALSQEVRESLVYGLIDAYNAIDYDSLVADVVSFSGFQYIDNLPELTSEQLELASRSQAQLDGYDYDTLEANTGIDIIDQDSYNQALRAQKGAEGFDSLLGWGSSFEELDEKIKNGATITDIGEDLNELAKILEDFTGISGVFTPEWLRDNWGSIEQIFQQGSFSGLQTALVSGENPVAFNPSEYYTNMVASAFGEAEQFNLYGGVTNGVLNLLDSLNLKEGYFETGRNEWQASGTQLQTLLGGRDVENNQKMTENQALYFKEAGLLDESLFTPEGALIEGWETALDDSKLTEAARALGYESVDQLVLGLETALNNGVKEFDIDTSGFNQSVMNAYRDFADAKNDEGQYYLNTAEDQQNYAEVLNTGYETAGAIGLKYYNQMAQEMVKAGVSIEEFNSRISNVDWTDAESVRNFGLWCENATNSTVEFDTALQAVESAANAAAKALITIAQAANEYTQKTSIADKLRSGEAITPEEYQSMVDIYGDEEARRMMTMDAMGQYHLAEGYSPETVASEIESSATAGYQAVNQEASAVLADYNSGYMNSAWTSQDKNTLNYAVNHADELSSMGVELTPEQIQAFTVASQEGTTYSDMKATMNDPEVFGENFDWDALFTALTSIAEKEQEESGEAIADAEERIPRENWEKEVSDLGLDVEETDKLGDSIQQMAEGMSEAELEAMGLSKALADNEELADELAKKVQRYNRAVDKITDSYEDWKKAIKSEDWKESSEAISEVKDTVEDMLDLPMDALDDLTLSAEDATEMLELMDKAAAGDVDAFNELQSVVAEDIMIGQGAQVDPSLQAALDSISTEVDNLPVGLEQPFMVGEGSAVSQDLYDSMNAVLAATAALGGDVAGNMQAVAEAMGMDVDVETKTFEVDVNSPDYVPGAPIYDENTGITYTPIETTLDTEKGTISAVAIKAITNKGSSFGGNVGTRGGSGSRPRRGGGGGRRGGGRGREAPRAEKKKDSEKERYHTITNVLEDLTDAFDKVSKASDRAFGKARIKLLEQQEEALQDLLSAQSTYLEEIEANLEADMDLLESMDFGVELQFDENGTLLNFEDLQNAMWDEYNSHIDKNGNVIGMTDEEWKKYEEEWQERMEALAKYEETQDLWKEAKQQLQDYINQIHDIRLEQVTYAVEIDIEASENALELLDYLLNKIGDSAWDAADAIANMGKQAQEYLGELVTNEDGSTSFVGGQINTIQGGIAGILGNHTKDVVDEKTGKVLQAASLTDADVQGFMNGDAAAIEKVRQMGLNGTLTDAEVQSLKDYHSQLLQANQALMDLRDSVHEKVLEAFQQFNEELQEGIDKIDHLGRMMQSYRNIVDIVGKENLGVSNTMLEAIGQGQVENKIDSLGGQKARVDSLKAMIADAEKKAASATTKEDKDKWKENIEEMKKELADAEEDFMGSWEEALQSIQEQFELAVSNAIETFSDALAGPLAGSLDELQASFDRQNNLAERFLPEYEKIYELNKLNRDITNSINDTDNVKAKQELAKLQEEINALEAEGTEVSRFQTEDLRRRYELKLAELALEEAKNAKSNVQMARNADGDWSYVYTADEEDVAAAEQTYEDRMFAIQQANAEYINEMQNSLIQAQADMASEIEAIMTDETLSMEEKMQKVNEIKDYYTEMFGYYSDELQYVMDQNGTAFEHTTLSALTGFQDLEDYNQNFYDATTAMMTDLDEAYAMWEENTEAAMNAAGTSIDGFADHLSEQTQAMVEDSDEARQSVEKLGQSAVKTFGDITTAVENWVTTYGEKISEILTKNEALATSFKNLLNEWSNFDNKDNQNPPPTDPGGDDDGGGDDNNEPEYMGQITIKKGYQYWGYKSPKGGDKNKVKVVNDDRQERTYKFTQMDTSTSRKRVYIPSEKVWVSSYDPDGPKRIKVEKFDTGGYTGSWGSEGRMAMLHEKEIVLNKADTANILTAVDMIRQVAKIIDLNAYSSAGFGSSIMGMASGSAGQFEQNVHITAEFPNATDRNEIYAAFTDIVNLASQYANR